MLGILRTYGLLTWTLCVIQLSENIRLFVEGGRRIHFRSLKRSNEGMQPALERVRDRKMDLLVHQCWHFHCCRDGMVHEIIWRLHSRWGWGVCLQFVRVHLQPCDPVFLWPGSSMPVILQLIYLQSRQAIRSFFVFFSSSLFSVFLAAGGHYKELNSLLNTNTR